MAHQTSNGHGYDAFGFFSGLLLGGLVGAAAGLLMAPYSGNRTRSLIQAKGIELKDQVESSARETRDRVETAAHDLRSKAETAVDTTRSKFEGRKAQVERTAEAVAQAAKEAWHDNEPA